MRRTSPGFKHGTMVRTAGLEPAQPFGRKILSLVGSDYKGRKALITWSECVQGWYSSGWRGVRVALSTTTATLCEISLCVLF